MDSLEAFKVYQQAVVSELAQALTLLTEAAREGRLPDLSAAPPGVRRTGTVAFVCLNLTLILVVSSRLRNITFATVESVLAIILLCLLVALVVGVPFGAVYLGMRGVAFLAASIMQSFPRLNAAVTFLLRQLGVGAAAATAPPP